MTNVNKDIPEATRSTGAQPDQEALWDEILQKIAPTTDTVQDEAWQNAVEKIRERDAQQLLDGQRFQGQGQ